MPHKPKAAPKTRKKSTEIDAKPMGKTIHVGGELLLRDLAGEAGLPLVGSRAIVGRKKVRKTSDGAVLIKKRDLLTLLRNEAPPSRSSAPERSTHSYTAFRWGHKWVVLALLVPVPWATRRSALPLLVALYRPKEENQKHEKRHKTPPQLLGQLVRILMRWFPDRKFIVTADGNYATHELAELAARTTQRLTLVSLFYPNANLVEPPPAYAGKGRPRVKGNDLPNPAEVVEGTPQRQILDVAWYGGGRRQVETVTGTAHWYKSGRPLVELRWVFVHDKSGTHRDSYFFTTESDDECSLVDRNLHRSVEHRDHLRGSPLLPPPAGHARLEPGHGVACRPVPLRTVHPGGLAVRAIAGSMEADQHHHLAGQARRDVLGRDHVGASLVVGGMGFRAARSSRRLPKTPARIPAAAAQRPGSGGLSRAPGRSPRTKSASLTPRQTRPRSQYALQE